MSRFPRASAIARATVVPSEIFAMNTPEGENAPLLRAPPRRPSYAAPSSVRNGVAATLVAGCVVATLAVSGRLGT